MKKFLILTILTMAGILGVNAQSVQTANEGYVGYSFLRQDVKFERPTFKFNENTDSHGFVGSYTRYVGGSETKAGVVGFTAEVGANIDSDGANYITALGGVTLKARNNKVVQPFVKVLGGVSRNSMDRFGTRNFDAIRPTGSLGGGVDFKIKGRYQWRFGADYLFTQFASQYQNAVRLNTGLVF